MTFQLDTSGVTSTVLRRGEARHTAWGSSLPTLLHETGETISAGLVKRLRSYALRYLTESGFEVSAWACEVCTMDGDEPPAERYYTVEFTNPAGGMLGIQGIMTQRGWPVLDHGVCVDTGRGLSQ